MNVVKESLKTPTYRAIYNQLYQGILSKEYIPGDRLPTEAELAKTFSTSRPTVVRAMQDLQAAGLIERKAGSGTYVRNQVQSNGRQFGLIVPGLGEAEVFDPICSQIARELQSQSHRLMWGDFESSDYEKRVHQAEGLSSQYIKEKVAGVFFAPLEWVQEKDSINLRILRQLEDAKIPVVFLDRDVDYPERTAHDLVGIDNSRAGAILTDHLLKLGCRRIDFLARPFSAPTVRQRIAGYRDALAQAGITAEKEWIHCGPPNDLDYVRELTNDKGLTALICANDETAVDLMSNLRDLNIEVPGQVRVAGFNDFKYAKMLAVPLTTVRMPCRELGQAAARVMLERIEKPEMPVRDILLKTELIIRRSCGEI